MPPEESGRRVNRARRAPCRCGWPETRVSITVRARITAVISLVWRKAEEISWDGGPALPGGGRSSCERVPLSERVLLGLEERATNLRNLCGLLLESERSTSLSPPDLEMYPPRTGLGRRLAVAGGLLLEPERSASLAPAPDLVLYTASTGWRLGESSGGAGVAFPGGIARGESRRHRQSEVCPRVCLGLKRHRQHHIWMVWWG